MQNYFWISNFFSDLYFCTGLLYHNFQCQHQNESMVSTMTLTCPENQVIKVLGVMYGRDTTWFCEHVNGDVTSCVSDTAMVTVEELCNGKNHCVLGLGEGLFGDPCPGIHKYLSVSYQCASKSENMNSRSLCPTFYPTALKGCRGIVFTHGVRMGGRASGKSLSGLYLKNRKV